MKLLLATFEPLGDAWGTAWSLSGIAQVHRSCGDTSRARSYFEASRQAFVRAGDWDGAAHCLDDIGHLYQAESRNQEAREAFLAAAVTTQDAKMRGWSWNNAGDLYRKEMACDDAMAAYSKALPAFEEAQFAEGQGWALENMGSIEYVLGRYPEALRLHMAAFAKFKRAQHWTGMGWSSVGIGRVHRMAGRYHDAIDAFQTGLRCFRHTSDVQTRRFVLQNDLALTYYLIGDYGTATLTYLESQRTGNQPTDARSQATALLNRGVFLRVSARYEQAHSTLQESLVLLRRVQDPLGEALGQVNLGLVDIALGDHPGADSAFRSAVEIFHRTKITAGESWALLGQSVEYRHQGKYARALQDLRRALSIVRRIGNRLLEPWILSAIGQTYLEARRWPEATDAYGQGQRLAFEIGDSDTLVDCYWGLGRVHEANGEFADAIRSFRRAEGILETMRRSAASEHLKLSLLDRRAGLFDDLVDCD